MDLQVSTRHTNDTTRSSIIEYANEKFGSLTDKLFRNHKNITPKIDIKVDFITNAKLFDCKLIMNVHGHTFIFQIKDRNIRRAIDVAVDNFHTQLTRFRGKNWKNY
jgi:ribosome-associated translation inhibitor RaiA